MATAQMDPALPRAQISVITFCEPNSEPPHPFAICWPSFQPGRSQTDRTANIHVTPTPTQLQLHSKT